MCGHEVGQVGPECVRLLPTSKRHAKSRSPTSMPPSTVPDYRIRTHPRPHDAESQSLALEGEGPHLWLKKATTDTERMDQKTAHSTDVAALHNQSTTT